MIQISKNIILGDGVDFATLHFRGVQNDDIQFSINGVMYSSIASTPTSLPDEYIASVEISCDTNMTIIVECGAERAIIYSVGVP